MRLSQSCSSVLSSLQRYKLQSVRAEKLWGAFHKFSLQEGLKLCKFYDKATDLKAHDIFWQLIMEKMLLSKFVYRPAVEMHTSTTSTRSLSSVEENAVSYTAGYVVKKLINKYSRSLATNPKSAAYLTLLKGMGGKLSERTSSGGQPSHPSEWTKIVDRGGLFHVSNTVYDLFLFLEMSVDEELTSIFKAKGKGIEKVRREKLDWLCENEEVQLVWGMLTDTLEETDEDFNQDLLKEIASLWITTRGYSKAHVVKEDYKRAKATSTKGKHSLRKELKRQNTESTSDRTE